MLYRSVVVSLLHFLQFGALGEGRAASDPLSVLSHILYSRQPPSGYAVCLPVLSGVAWGIPISASIVTLSSGLGPGSALLNTV